MRGPLLLLLVVLTGCAKHSYPEPPIHRDIPEPVADSIESVLYLVGDAGEATMANSPVLRRLRNEVEQWSETLTRENSLVVLYLGDNVYPRGMRDRTDPGWAQDSTHLQSQIDVVSGPNGKKNRARAVFIAGNHDWGHMSGPPGVARLRNMQLFIERRSPGVYAALLPAAGQTGPANIDISRHVRLLLIDTSWWLLEADYNEKTRFLQRLDTAMANAGDRSVVIAAHHPWTSGSSHGGLISFWEGVGVKWLMARSGAALQDINSLPYRDLREQFTRIFVTRGTPLLFAGGHDHALQVIKGMSASDPKYIVVSGAASKSSKVGLTDGTVYRNPGPGFMRFVALKNGAVDLFVVDANPGFLMCNAADEAVRQQCLDVGPSEFRTAFSVRLKEPGTRPKPQ
jgi:hypothetical protein